MKSVSKIFTLLLTLAIYTSCTKQSTDAVISAVQSSSASQDNKVITPFGPMNKSNVHFVEEGYSISTTNGRLQKVENTTGKIVEDFGPSGSNDQITGKASAMSGINLPALASGWITYAYWYNDITKPVTSFSTKWIVPSFPSTNSGQTLFIFNGMQDGFSATSHILQPVLQWGFSAAGGAFDWEITNWYVSSNQAFFGNLIKVSPGTSLQGIIESIAKHGSTYDYLSSFKGYPKNSQLQVNNAPQLFWAAETLESYSVQKNSNYPPDAKIKMSSIRFLQSNKNAPLNWTAVNQVGVPQHTTVVKNGSPGGEVDIFFKK